MPGGYSSVGDVPGVVEVDAVDTVVTTVVVVPGGYPEVGGPGG